MLTSDVAEGMAACACLAVPIFDELVSRLEPELRRYALRLTRDGDEADDLFQETMIKAFRAYGRLPADANRRAWLYRIATNTFLSDRRKLDRLESLDAQDLWEPAAPEIDHGAAIDARALLADVERAVLLLPEKQRVALILRKYQEMGYAEIAVTLQCSEPAARANVHEALRKLKERFHERL